MSKMTIIEGNSNDKDNVRAYMVKGEPGVSPTIGVSKEDGVTTLTIKDAEGTHTETIADGDDLVGGVPTDGVIGFDGEAADIPDGYEVFDDVNLVKSFNTVAEMKEDEYLVAGDTCQTLGYYSANDGGAGLYKIVDDSQLVDDGGSIHNLSNGLKAELIIDDNTINVKQFGAKGDNVQDDTNFIQNAIDKTKNIYIPNGTYLVSTLNIPSYTSIIGQSSHNTIIKSNNENIRNFITMSSGPVQHIRMENLYIMCGINSIQNGLYFKAIATENSPYHGGLWLSMFKNIIVKGFGGFGLSLLAGSNGLLPIQGITFERVEVSSGNTNGVPLLIEGQTEQIQWNQCAFSNGSSEDEYCAMFRRERVDGQATGDTGGGAQSFYQCYFGCSNNNRKIGIYFERTTGVKFFSCYFENLSSICLQTTTTRFIHLLDPVLINVQQTLCNLENNCELKITNPQGLGTKNVLGWGKLFIEGSETRGLTFEHFARDVGVNNNTINITGYVNNCGSSFNNINQGDGFGYTFDNFIVNATANLIISSGGNILLNSNITLNLGEKALFTHLGNKYSVVKI